METPAGTVFSRASNTEPQQAFSAGLAAHEPGRRDTLEHHQGTTGQTQYASTSYNADPGVAAPALPLPLPLHDQDRPAVH